MINPVLVKELRSRMRGRRAFLVQAIYILLLSVFFYLGYLSRTQSRSYYYRQDMGKEIFTWISFTQLVLVTLIAPAFTCGSVTGEKEQKSLGLLLISLLSPRQIVWGKLISSLSYLFLLIFASIPLLCICTIFGGLSPEEIGITYLLLLFSALTFGIVGLFCSTLFRRTYVSTAVTYGIVLFLVVGIILIGALIEEFIKSNLWGYRPMSDAAWDIWGSSSPFYPLGRLLIENYKGATPLGPPWLITLGYYSILSLLLYAITMKSFKRMTRRGYDGS